jgi:4-amino-4-deoxy-L-arabinose transferase-like glycosyltransferase
VANLLLVAALSAFALIPLTPPHFFASSDGLYHIYRAIEVHRCLESGVLICRWMTDQFLGYGTPLLNLYSPGVYYVIAAFHLLGLGWVDATKASMAVFMIFSGLAAYGYATDFLSRRAALVAAVVYVYVPYHLVNAYYRGDLRLHLHRRADPLLPVPAPARDRRA